MRKLVIALAFLLLLGACSPIEDFFDASERIVGSNVLTSETRDVDAFDKIDFEAVGEVRITTGEAQAITVSGDDNLVPRIKTIVSGSTLTISAGNRLTLVPRQDLVYELSMPELTALDITGVANVDVAPLETDEFALSLSGVADITIERVEVDSLTVVISGAGSVTLEGTATRQDATISGVGAYDAADLESRDVVVQATGTGSATVWATDSVDIAASGVGTVRYWGDPSSTSVTSTGIGGVTTLGDR